MSSHFLKLTNLCKDEVFSTELRKLYLDSKFPYSIREIKNVSIWMEQIICNEYADTNKEMETLIGMIDTEINILKNMDSIPTGILHGIENGKDTVLKHFCDPTNLVKEIKTLLSNENILMEKNSQEKSLTHKIATVKPLDQNNFTEIKDGIKLLIIEFEKLCEEKDYLVELSSNYQENQDLIGQLSTNLCVKLKLFMTKLIELLKKQIFYFKEWKIKQYKSIYSKCDYLMNQLESHDLIFNDILAFIIKIMQLFNDFLNNDGSHLFSTKDYNFIYITYNIFIETIDELIQNLFVIDEYPSERIIKITKGQSSHLNIRLRLLGGNALGVLTIGTPVAIMMTQGSNNDSTVEIQNAEKRNFTNAKNSSACVAQFQRLVLKFPSNWSPSIEEQKIYFYFETEITYWDKKFKSKEVYSLPLIVITKSSQEVMARGTLVWHAAFCKETSIFECRTSVPWIDFAEVINNLFLKYTETELNAGQMNFLAHLASGNNNINMQSNWEVRFNNIVKDNLPGKNHSFWKWMFSCLNLVTDHVCTEWKNKRIIGFISKDEAEEKLKDCADGTFILRFSESVVPRQQGRKVYASLSLAIKERDRQTQESRVFFVNDSLSADFIKNSLANVLNSMEVPRLDDLTKQEKLLKYLYPNYCIEEVFPESSATDNEKNGYSKVRNIINIDLTVNNNGQNTTLDSYPNSVASNLQGGNNEGGMLSPESPQEPLPNLDLSSIDLNSDSYGFVDPAFYNDPLFRSINNDAAINDFFVNSMLDQNENDTLEIVPDENGDLIMQIRNS